MFFLCSPLAFNWDKSIAGGTCLNSWAASISVSIINLVLDIIVIASPNANVVGTSSADVEETGPHSRLWYWRKVSLSPPLCVVSEASWTRANDGGANSICIITILRIVSVVNLNPKDLSYSAIDDAIWSELEPCLGIINACLPVIPPVVSQISRLAVSRWRLWSRSGSTAQDTHAGPSFAGQGLRPSDTEARSFRRLEEDDYPLTKMSFGGQNYADAIAHGLPDLASGNPDPNNSKVTRGNDNIVVMKGWHVQSSSADTV